MVNKLNYQQARRVRGSKFSNLFLDQLAQQDSVTSAIGKTISLKTQAKIKGIKESFDPLNMVKFLTFGSKLGPALFGKLTGRKQKDIDYFTGRSKSVVGGMNTADKLKGTGQGGDSAGINEQLSKIYSFLKTSREDDIKLKEKSKNFEEELISEKKLRHDELIETLNKLMNNIQGGKPTFEKVQSGESMIDMVKRMIGDAFDSIKDLMALKDILKSVPWSKLLGVMRWFGGPIGIALLGITSAAMFSEWLKGFIGENVVNKNVITPEKAVELLRTPDAYRAIEEYGGREALLEMAKTGYIKAKEILERGDIKEINQAGGVDFLKKVESRGAIDTSNIAPAADLSQFKPTGPKRPETGGVALPAQQKEWDKTWSKVYNPKTGKRLDLDMASSMSEQDVNNEMTRMKGRTQSVSPSVVAPEPVVPTPAGKLTPTVTPSPVSSLTNNNITMAMDAAYTGAKASKPIVNNTVNNTSSKNKERPGLRPSQISVRNDEPTFMGLIINSTRVV
jgi:hypothetical protein